MINIRIIEVSEVGREYTKNIPLALLVGFLFIFEFFSLIPFGSYDVSFFNFINQLIKHEALAYATLAGEYLDNLFIDKRNNLMAIVWALYIISHEFIVWRME